MRPTGASPAASSAGRLGPGAVEPRERHDQEGHGCEREQRSVRAPSLRGRHSSSHGLPRHPERGEPQDRQQGDLDPRGHRPTVADPHRLPFGAEPGRPTERDLGSLGASLQLPRSVVLRRDEHRPRRRRRRPTLRAPACSAVAGTVRHIAIVEGSAAPRISRSAGSAARLAAGGSATAFRNITKPDAGTEIRRRPVRRRRRGRRREGHARSATTKRMPNGARRAPPCREVPAKISRSASSRWSGPGPDNGRPMSSTLAPPRSVSA